MKDKILDWIALSIAGVFALFIFISIIGFVICAAFYAPAVLIIPAIPVLCFWAGYRSMDWHQYRRRK